MGDDGDILDGNMDGDSGQDTSRDTRQDTSQVQRIRLIIDFCSVPRARSEIEEFIGIKNQLHDDIFRDKMCYKVVIMMSIDLKGKTYLELSHTEPIAAEEIESLYDGYWIYVIKAEFDEKENLVRGIPVVIGTMAFAGSEDGIYKKYKTEENAPRTEVILLNDNFISALVF